MSAAKVDVTPKRRGGWSVRSTDHRDGLSFVTLDAAIREAHRWAADGHPCELVVRDAYHRVVGHEFIDGEESVRERTSRATVNA